MDYQKKIEGKINLDLVALQELIGMMEWQYEQGRVARVAAYLPELKRAVKKLEKHLNKINPAEPCL